MDDRLGEALRDCFADKCQPSAETRAILHKKLLAAERRRATRRETLRDWAVVAYALAFSAVLTFAVWVFTGNGIVACVCAAWSLFSAVSGVALAIVCQKERSKGGRGNVVACD
jgi:hypothetical protein